MNQSTGKGQDIDRGARLRSERNRLGLSLVAFAKKAGVSKGSQILYEKGNPPTVDYLVGAGEAGADIMFILLGKSGQNIEPRVGTQVRRPDGTVVAIHKGAPTPLNEVEQLTVDLVQLPLFDIHASAGLGMPVGPQVQLGALAFDRAFLRAQGADPESCSIIAASGDSMEPAIPDGALLVVDHGQTEIRHGHIMVVNVGEDLLVKRIRRRLDGLVDLISDNPAYPPETVGRDMIDQLRIVGRVVFFCRAP